MNSTWGCQGWFVYRRCPPGSSASARPHSERSTGSLSGNSSYRPEAPATVGRAVPAASKPRWKASQGAQNADAAPTDGVEITAIDEPTQRRQAPRSVLVDVIEHDTGIETVLPAEVDAAAEPAWALHQPTHSGKVKTAGPAQPLILVV